MQHPLHFRAVNRTESTALAMRLYRQVPIGGTAMPGIKLSDITGKLKEE